ncbi:cupin domain-containing protein [Rhodococcus jostii]|uniref:cupin domain-containing protein n=1 Tax=Rhodococcus jostii TaxID=132919 RepID=UPI003629467B
MGEIKVVSAASAPLEKWQPEGVTIHQGDPDGHGFTLNEGESRGAFGTGVFSCEPSQTSYELTSNEIIYVLEGSVSIALEDTEPVLIHTGDLAFLPKGHTSHWTFHSTFKEVWFLVD